MEPCQNQIPAQKNNRTCLEIGSEFWDVPVTEKQNSLFLESIQWFLSGRSALQAIIAELGETWSVSLPSWCCDSMIKPFVDANLSIKFYPVVVENGELVQEIRTDTDVMFLMDYFGYNTPTSGLIDYHGIIIRDVTHSLFSSTYYDADYYFGSLRKWCGVWTGGYAWTKDGHPLPLETAKDRGYVALRDKAMGHKREYIEDGLGDKGYLDSYAAAEECLAAVGIAPAAERDVTMARHLDVKLIKDRRRANAAVLRAAFPDWLVFPNLAPTDTPMFVPVLVPDGKRDDLRRYLINHEIYCPIHWPVSKYHRLDERTGYIYQNELSLVCDQRYTEEDMNRMVETIKMFMED